MRKLLLFGVMAVSAFAAETWTGKLIDSTCYDQAKTADPKAVPACDATSTTTTFGFLITGTVYKLDDVGNTKASLALKNRADRSTEPGKPQSSQVIAKITGSKTEDNMLKVETVEVQ